MAKIIFPLLALSSATNSLFYAIQERVCSLFSIQADQPLASLLQVYLRSSIDFCMNGRFGWIAYHCLPYFSLSCISILNWLVRWTELFWLSCHF